MYFVSNFSKAWVYSILPKCRRRGDLIETFKIMKGLVDYSQNMFRVQEKFSIPHAQSPSHFASFLKISA